MARLTGYGHQYLHKTMRTIQSSWGLQEKSCKWLSPIHKNRFNRHLLLLFPALQARYQNTNAVVYHDIYAVRIINSQP